MSKVITFLLFVIICSTMFYISVSTQPNPRGGMDNSSPWIGSYQSGN